MLTYFFVISGFVISKLILTQRSNETFSLTSFYIKRVKRLAPALLVMVYLTLIVFGFILSPLDLIKSIEGSLWISAYLANFFSLAKLWWLLLRKCIKCPLSSHMVSSHRRTVLSSLASFVSRST